jgi:hypothetical protein
MLTVSQLIDILYKCQSDAEVKIAIAGEELDGYSFNIIRALEVNDKFTNDPATVYLLHD